MKVVPDIPIDEGAACISVKERCPPRGIAQGWLWSVPGPSEKKLAEVGFQCCDIIIFLQMATWHGAVLIFSHKNSMNSGPVILAKVTSKLNAPMVDEKGESEVGRRVEGSREKVKEQKGRE